MNSSSSEFKIMDEKELKLLMENTNVNTKHLMSTWLKRYKKVEHNGAQTDLARVCLDGVLQWFYAELVKKDGNEYEPESLKVMIAAINRYVKDKCVLKDKNFEMSRKVLNEN